MAVLAKTESADMIDYSVRLEQIRGHFGKSIAKHLDNLEIPAYGDSALALAPTVEALAGSGYCRNHSHLPAHQPKVAEPGSFYCQRPGWAKPDTQPRGLRQPDGQI